MMVLSPFKMLLLCSAGAAAPSSCLRQKRSTAGDPSDRMHTTGWYSGPSS
jgi:hypothetical protein